MNEVATIQMPSGSQVTLLEDGSWQSSDPTLNEYLEWKAEKIQTADHLPEPFSPILDALVALGAHILTQRPPASDLNMGEIA